MIKMAQLKGQSPLEFFFLDEGFGTLDNNLLDTVIDSLERLSRKERVIGLISHVPELRLRIARRLIVDPPTSQGDGSRVRIEKAYRMGLESIPAYKLKARQHIQFLTSTEAYHSYVEY